MPGNLPRQRRGLPGARFSNDCLRPTWQKGPTQYETMEPDRRPRGRSDAYSFGPAFAQSSGASPAEPNNERNQNPAPSNTQPADPAANSNPAARMPTTRLIAAKHSKRKAAPRDALNIAPADRSTACSSVNPLPGCDHSGRSLAKCYCGLAGGVVGVTGEGVGVVGRSGVIVRSVDVGAAAGLIVL